MKCISCETEINPKWKHAIDNNVCPFCGSPIMEEHLKNCISNLTIAMNDMLKYVDQLDDWMLSNHNYIKTDSPNLSQYVPKEMLATFSKDLAQKEFEKKKSESAKFTVKVKTDAGEEEIVAEKIQDEDRTNEFFQRAEVFKTNKFESKGAYESPTEKTEHFKKVVQHIKKAGSSGLANEFGTAMNVPPEMLEQADPEAIAEYQQLLTEDTIISSIDTEEDLDSDLPGADFILQANIAAAQGKAGNNSAKDLAALQRLQAKTSQARKNMTSGARGSFSR